MKKFLALFLVLVMAFSCILMSCNKDEEGESEESSDDEPFVGLNTSATTSGTGNNGGQTPEETGNTHTDFTFTEVNEKVYVTVARLSLRSDTRIAEDTWRATALFGQAFTRIRYNAQWSEIQNEAGEKYFVASEYLTTNDGSVVFTDMEEKTVYVSAAKALNLRHWTDASSDADNIGVQIKRGVALTLTGMSKNGTWARVTYEGNTYYCNASYLSETVPSESTDAPTTPNIPEQG